MDSHLWGWHGDVGTLAKSGRRHVHKRPPARSIRSTAAFFHSFPQVDLAAKRLSHWVLHSPLDNKKYELLCIKNMSKRKSCQISLSQDVHHKDAVRILDLVSYTMPRCQGLRPTLLWELVAFVIDTSWWKSHTIPKGQVMILVILIYILMIPWTRLEDIGRINGGDKNESRWDDSLSWGWECYSLFAAGHPLSPALGGIHVLCVGIWTALSLRHFMSMFLLFESLCSGNNSILGRNLMKFACNSILTNGNEWLVIESIWAYIYCLTSLGLPQQITENHLESPIPPYSYSQG